VGLLAADLGDELVLHRVVHESNDVACGGVVGFLLQAVRVDEAAVLKPELLGLAVHFVDESFNIIFMAFVRELEGLLDDLLHFGGLVRKRVDFSLGPLQDW